MNRSTGNRTGASGQGLGSVRVLIADSQPRVRQSLAALLTLLRWSKGREGRVSIEIVGEADSGRQLLEQILALRPDVVVLDLPTHGTDHQPMLAAAKPDGLTTICTIKEQWPQVWIVVLTLYATDRAAVMQAGADVFLLKGCPTDELLEAVMAAAR